jgi:hypothetical protein
MPLRLCVPLEGRQSIGDLGIYNLAKEIPKSPTSCAMYSQGNDVAIEVFPYQARHRELLAGNYQFSILI